jgi:hypothetical protein
VASTSGVRAHTTQTHPAYEPSHSDVSRPWQLLIVGLLLVAIVAISVRSVCLPEVPGANERGLGVRHQRRGTTWDHCEPWIRRVLSH